ncbi:MAG TPA: ABC transporter ATP-binding protein [Acidimicrobiales bacterium]|jgi:oligopeptide/dipeptide ABC transporter ATP-binding protein|nr:ABC transporter ATP-binding protein [Acidimicrobiales bacterium]
MTAVLEITGLEVRFATPEGPVSAVRGVDLRLDEGKVLGVVGESGSGKTVTMLAVLGLLGVGADVSGSVKYRGRELIGLEPRQLRKLRGSAIAMIFQDPRTSLNPVQSIGHQIVEGIRIHHPDVSRKQASKRAVELLDLVGIPQPDRRVRDYPHQFSGGMCQRAMVAMAVANDPDVLVADEATTALDVTIQAQILDLLRSIRQEKGVAIVLISHDLGVVAGLADDVAVMYAGRVVERGPVDEVYNQARHPYTRGLLASVPRLTDSRRGPLLSIGGGAPSLLHLPAGCAFHPRCAYERPNCTVDDPALRPVATVEAACHYAEDLGPVATGPEA